MNNLKEEINKVIPNDLKVKLKEMLVKFQEVVVTEPMPSTEVAPTENPMKEMKTKDGLILQVEELEVGYPVKQVTEAGIVDVADGDYEIETGEMVTVVGGVISNIVVPEVVAPEAAPMVEPNAEMTSLKQKVTELSEMVAKLSATVKQQQDSLVVTLSAVNAIVEQPAAEPIQRPTLNFRVTKEKQLENLSKLKK
jgi:hypothetical protein